MPYNKEELMKLPVEEKIQLAEELWESIDKEAIPASENEILIAQERYEEYLKNPEAGMSWEELRKLLWAKHKI